MSRYNNISRLYKFIELLMEGSAFSQWRMDLLNQVRGNSILEVGVGTGLNLQYYQKAGFVDKEIICIDISHGMLQFAERRMKDTHINIKLHLMDLQNMDFPDSYFDTVIGTCVLCSVSDHLKGLREISRVLRPEGRLLLIEHVLSYRPILSSMMKRTGPIIARLTGENIHRETVKDIRAAGFKVLEEKDLYLDIVKMINAVPDIRGD